MASASVVRPPPRTLRVALLAATAALAWMLGAAAGGQLSALALALAYVVGVLGLAALGVRRSLVLAAAVLAFAALLGVAVVSPRGAFACAALLVTVAAAAYRGRARELGVLAASVTALLVLAVVTATVPLAGILCGTVLLASATVIRALGARMAAVLVASAAALCALALLAASGPRLGFLLAIAVCLTAALKGLGALRGAVVFCGGAVMAICLAALVASAPYAAAIAAATLVVGAAGYQFRADLLVLARRALAILSSSGGLVVAGVVVFGIALMAWPTSALLGGVLALVVSLAIRAPSYAIVLAVVLFGLEGTIKIRFSLEGSPLPVAADAAGAAYLDLALGIALVGLLRWSGLRPLVDLWRAAGGLQRVSLVLLAAWLVLSVVQIPQSGDLAVGALGFRLTQWYVLVTLCGLALLSMNARRELLLRVLLLAMTAIAGYGAIRALIGPAESERLYALDNPTTALVYSAGGLVFKNIGSFSGAVGLVSFLAPAGVTTFFLGLLLPRYRLLAWSTFGLVVVAILGSYVRAGVVAVALSMAATGTLLVLGRRVQRRRKLFFLGAVIGALILGAGATRVAFGSSPELQARAAGIVNPLADESMQIRFRTWSDSLDIIRERPLGTGLGTVGRASETALGATTTDNSYLKVFREQGLAVGLMFVLGLSGTILATGRALVRIGASDRPLGIAAFGGFLAFLLLCLDSETIELPGKVLAWLLLGIVLHEVWVRPATATQASHPEER